MESRSESVEAGWDAGGVSDRATGDVVLRVVHMSPVSLALGAETDRTRWNTVVPPAEVADDPEAVASFIRSDLAGAGKMLLLSSRFRSPHAGETFRFLVQVRNERERVAESVTCRMELQTPSERLLLLDTATSDAAGSSATSASAGDNWTLAPRAAWEHLLSAVFREPGAHQLLGVVRFRWAAAAATAVEVGTASPSTSVKRHAFRIQVRSAWRVQRTLLFPAPGSAAAADADAGTPGRLPFRLCVDVENVSDVPMYWQRAEYEPLPPLFTERADADLHRQLSTMAVSTAAVAPEPDAAGDAPARRSVLLAPGDIYRAAVPISVDAAHWRTEPTPVAIAATTGRTAASSLEAPVSVGILSVHWRSAHGMHGWQRLPPLTIPRLHLELFLQRLPCTRSPSGVVHWQRVPAEVQLLLHSDAEAVVVVERPFRVHCTVRYLPSSSSSSTAAAAAAADSSPRTRRLYVQVRRDRATHLVPVGVSGRRLGELLPGQSCAVTFTLIPLTVGRVSADGFRCVDVESGEIFEAPTPLPDVLAHPCIDVGALQVHVQPPPIERIGREAALDRSAAEYVQR
ncbi:hypothetical protein CDCA_CDCA05G1568 [Cyanidium caldarium]|uniref:Uncharacterized protein n=1 Tax=Cyanidium caldarium TaxID=2771 RepID=A0AAV9ITE4_CYACA|nr:hypothetical protein CDCA_CDCA05G1568 [Cyanidium caldarium]